MTTDRPVDELVRRLAPRFAEPGGPTGYSGPHRGSDGRNPDLTAPVLPGPDSPAARALRAGIVASPRPAPARRAHVTARTPGGGRSPRARRGALVGLGLATLVAGGILMSSALGPPSAPTGPAAVAADALSITTEGDLVVARVSDPAADPARYAAEFAEHGLDVDLTLVPASPSAVGTVIYLDENATATGTDDRPVEAIESPGECHPGGGGACPVGIRIPAGYTNRIEVTFGREAASGEPYDATNDASAPGEALEGLDLTGLRVAEARDLIAGRDQEATEYRTLNPGTAETVAVDAGDVPGDWYVHAVSLWAPGEVLVHVGPDDEPATPEPPVPTVPPTTAPPGMLDAP